MKNTYKFIVVIVLAFTVTACFNKKRPNFQYFPDMYESPSYETYGDYPIFPGGSEAQAPVENTISRGWEVPEFAGDNQGKKDAAANLTNPLPYTERNLNAGKELYNIYCAICHGDKGDGKGPLTQREKILGIPSYDDPGRDITDGDIYHTIYYGLNDMGSYASQTTNLERWQIVHYVMDLRNELEGNEKREFVEDTTTNNEHFDKEIDPVIGRRVMVSTEKK